MGGWGLPFYLISDEVWNHAWRAERHHVTGIVGPPIVSSAEQEMDPMLSAICHPPSAICNLLCSSLTEGMGWVTSREVIAVIFSVRPNVIYRYSGHQSNL